MIVIASPNRHVGRLSPIRVVVIHTVESGEDGGVAEAVAKAFADPARQASAHITVDTDSEVRSVQDKDTAWAAPGANADGLQLELAGRAGQTTGQWTDPGSKAILERGAQVVAAWCKAYSIPAVHLTDGQLGGGRTKGIVGHVQVSTVFKRSNHWDPGPDFPWGTFLARVQAISAPRTAPPGPSRSTPRKPIPPKPQRSMPVKLVVDGDFGPATKKRLQQWAGVAQDGILGKQSWAAIQRKVGAAVDGVFGPATVRAIQRMVRVTQDGDLGPVTIAALQTYLNKLAT